MARISNRHPQAPIAPRPQTTKPRLEGLAVRLAAVSHTPPERRLH